QASGCLRKGRRGPGVFISESRDIRKPCRCNHASRRPACWCRIVAISLLDIPRGIFAEEISPGNSPGKSAKEIHMTQFNEADLTAEVIKTFENTPDPRAKFLLQELVKSLHDYVRRTDLTFEEWEYAIDFLTRTGHMCTPIRQEFILLSDVMGVSM